MTDGQDSPTLVTLIPGDGIGPEVVDATRRIVEASGAPITWEECQAGAEVFKRGLPSGVPPETIESVSKTRVVLKGPLETPIGFGEKSANVTLRKLFETYANVRPVREMPGVKTPYSGRGIDLVIVRENVEDLYAGIEYMQTPGVAQALKLISEKGSEKIARFAFEYARSEQRIKVACATKANIMKLSEGTLKRVFERVSPGSERYERNRDFLTMRYSGGGNVTAPVTSVGGSSFVIHIAHAIAAINAGYCTTALITHGQVGRSARYRQPADDNLPGPQFETPYGLIGAAINRAMACRRYMHQ